MTTVHHPAGRRATIELTVNGQRRSGQAEPRMLLSDFLRHELQAFGVHVGCEHGVCGACTVLVGGRAMRSCTQYAVQADGADITTVEGLAAAGTMNALQSAFADEHALQCGFCTPGMLMAAQDLLRQKREPDREEIREHLSGNYCRCTGYQAIIDAVESTARARMGRAP
jgi:carbon-monoxide dehydrogenase small subunit